MTDNDNLATLLAIHTVGIVFLIIVMFVQVANNTDLNNRLNKIESAQEATK